MLALDLDTDDLTASFDRLARTLFDQYLLCVGARRYQLTELEFYYNTPDRAADNFAHVHRRPYPNGSWRLHGAGLDLVLAQEGRYYGGILLRGMQRLDEHGEADPDDYLDGPWRTATRCIEDKGAVTATHGFYLQARHTPVARPFVKGPRVGLILRQAADLPYLARPWRCVTLPIRTQRYRHLLYLEARHRGGVDLAAFGLSERQRANCERYYRAGQTMDAEDFVGGGKTVQNTAQWLGWAHRHELR